MAEALLCDDIPSTPFSGVARERARENICLRVQHPSTPPPPSIAFQQTGFSCRDIQLSLGTENFKLAFCPYKKFPDKYKKYQ